MNFGAFIEMIKTRLKKISLGKDAGNTHKSKGKKVTKPAKVSKTKKEGKKKTSTGSKPKIKR